MGQILRACALLCLMGGAAYAADIAKPAGGVEAFLPDYGVTVAVVAINIGGLGEGLAILEKRPTGLWYLCHNCFPTPTSNLANEIAFQGGTVQYIEAQRPAINAVFRQRYPEIGTPAPLPTVTPRDQLNAGLANAFKLDSSGLSPK